MNIPDYKIFHIIHVSKLPAILSTKYLLSDSEVRKFPSAGETIGMDSIKRRRLEELTLSSHPGLHVGECVPFYFCPRSIMLYMFHMRNNADIKYQGGQEPIIHLVADLKTVVNWANKNGLRWAFTTANAGSRYFDDFSDLRDLNKINWKAVETNYWADCKDEKQSEFLIEQCLPWKLIEYIGVYSFEWRDEVNRILKSADYRPTVEIKNNWYY